MYWTVAAVMGIALFSHTPASARTIATIAPDPASGRMVVSYTDGHEVFIGRCGEETAFSAPTRSLDGQTVAWTAFSDAPNPVASTLVLFRGDRVLTRIDADTGIAAWGFYGHGRWIGIAHLPEEAGKQGTCAAYDGRTGNPAGTMSWQPAAADPCALAFRSLGARDHH